MQLYVLRHADAEDRAPSDAERRLTVQGEEQARRVARFCAAHELRPSLILTSPYARAEQTARPVADQVGAPLEVAEWLASGLAPDRALREMAAYQDQAAVMLVGHQPDLSQLIALLLGLPSGDQLSVTKASLTGLEVFSWRPAGALFHFFLPCRMM